MYRNSLWQPIRSQAAAQGREAQGAHEGHEFRGVQEAAAVLRDGNAWGRSRGTRNLGKIMWNIYVGFTDS